MASNPYVNKVDLANGTTLIDLTADTATQADVAQGKYFHLPTGERVQGTASGGGGTGGVTQDQDGYIVLDDQPGGGGGSGATVVASGTFTGPNTYYITIPVGTTCPTTNFIFLLWTEAEVPYDANYKIVQLTMTLDSEYGKAEYYSSSEYRIVPKKTIDENNAGTITTLDVLVSPMAFTTIRQGSRAYSGYSGGVENPKFPVNSSSISIYWSRGNSQYKFPAVIYKWKLLYYGSDYANESISI